MQPDTFDVLDRLCEKLGLPKLNVSKATIPLEVLAWLTEKHGVKYGTANWPHQLPRPPIAVAGEKKLFEWSGELLEGALSDILYTLTKLDLLPPLSEHATTEEIHTRKRIPIIMEGLKSSWEALKAAYKVRSLENAAWAYGSIRDLAHESEHLFDLPEIGEGLASVERRKRGAEGTRKKFAKRRAELKAKYQPDIDRRVREGQSFELALTYTANQHNMRRETLRKYVVNPCRTFPKKV